MEREGETAPVVIHSHAQDEFLERHAGHPGPGDHGLAVALQDNLSGVEGGAQPGGAAEAASDTWRQGTQSRRQVFDAQVVPVEGEPQMRFACSDLHAAVCPDDAAGRLPGQTRQVDAVVLDEDLAANLAGRKPKGAQTQSTCRGSEGGPAAEAPAADAERQVDLDVHRPFDADRFPETRGNERQLSELGRRDLDGLLRRQGERPRTVLERPVAVQRPLAPALVEKAAREHHPVAFLAQPRTNTVDPKVSASFLLRDQPILFPPGIGQPVRQDVQSPWQLSGRWQSRTLPVQFIRILAKSHSTQGQVLRHLLAAQHGPPILQGDGGFVDPDPG